MENGELLFVIVATTVFVGFMGVLAYVSFTEDGTR
jgi:hypothetical protein